MRKKLILKIRKWLKPNLHKPLSTSERYSVMILLQLVRDKNAILMLHPECEKYYIHLKDKNVLVICDLDVLHSITFINHRYNYTIHLDERACTHVQNILLQSIKTRRQLLEIQFLSNTVNSLHIFLNELFQK